MQSRDDFKAIYKLFEEQAQRNPNYTAIYLDDRRISYDTFNKQANQYARFLQKKGLPHNGIVGIQLSRSYDMLLAIFAVFKAGCAYLPLDPAAPQLRNQRILEDGQIECLIVDADADNSSAYGVSNLQLLNIHEEVSQEDSHNMNAQQGKKDLAYVMYTSGSTGNPKGVLISHGALVNRIDWMQQAFPIGQGDVIFQKTHPCFDVSVWEICWWAIAGAGVVLLPAGKEHDIKLFTQMIERYQIGIIHFVPSVFRIFLRYIQEDFSLQGLKSLRYVFLSGEMLDAASVNLFNNLFKDTEAQLINLYGPTEATIDVSYFVCDKHKEYQSIPIGKAIKNIQLFVLDDDLKQTGKEPGELYISGVGLSQGYLNNAQLTKDFFLDNPYFPGKKMYRTGDLACWNSDNELMFLGRKDDQVKLHGIRIELGEIEFHLSEHPRIREVVVICEKQDLLDNRLIAFIILKDGQGECSSDEYKAFLKHRLPSYMIPEQYVWLNSFPIKANGKIDKLKLLDLAHSFLA